MEKLTNEELKRFFGKYSCDECGSKLIATRMEDGMIVLECPDCDLHQNVTLKKKKRGKNDF